MKCFAFDGEWILCIPESEVIATIMVAESPLHRLLEPAEVAAAAVYLCSDAAASITSSAFMLDGGWTAQ